jgi:hypothetical protein
MMALVQHTSAMAALSFARHENTRSEMPAAAPALEITRLLNRLGQGFTEALFIKSYSKLFTIYPHLVDVLSHQTQAD